MLKRILNGYGLRRSVQHNQVLVDTAGKLVQTLAIAAEVLFEYGQVEGSQVLRCLGPKFRQLLRNFADARASAEPAIAAGTPLCPQVGRQTADRVSPARGQLG